MKKLNRTNVVSPVLLASAVALLMAGCTPRGEHRLRLHADVSRQPKPVVVPATGIIPDEPAAPDREVGLAVRAVDDVTEQPVADFADEYRAVGTAVTTHTAEV